MTAPAARLCTYLAALTGEADRPATSSAGWDDVVALAEIEGLAPALAFGVARHPSETMAPATAGRLAARFREALARHVVMSRDLATLLRALAAERIPAIPLKGAFLAETVYPHPAVRPMSDIDVLIHEGDRLRVDEILRGLGYSPGVDDHSWAFDQAYDAAAAYDGPGGARVDLHWRLVNDPRFAWDHAESVGVWDRAVPVTLAGQPALALAPEDLVLSLAAHLAIHHGLSGLVWYWDVKLVLDHWVATLDWEALLDRAGRWRMRRVLFFVLRRLGDLFPLPEAVERRMAPLAPRGPRAASVRWLVAWRGEELRRFEHVIPLLLTDRFRDLVGALSPAICPSPAWLRARYGGGSVSLPRAYLAHGARMASVLGRTGRGLLRAQGRRSSFV